MSANDAHEILPGLWLGNREAALSEDWLSKHGVQTVFNCTKNIPFHGSVTRRYRVPVDDNLQPVEIDNLLAWAPETQLKLLREWRRGQPVLVHCHAGMQRSAAVVAMFLMTLGKAKTAEEAIATVKRIRPIAFTPGANFERSIKGWERMLGN
jgi:rhodanese-related sulfurtransferase